ncbi:hypothetical protein [Parachlamydia sp. AcF125]|uniref:hypothetical protein n=1 Tax=Parachlamydia sp. AcF125 TaxID=2795736 RepID=UPI001BCA4A93|nr:hypothetical protein [Parachlamydia sp. AcF125]MBS4169153.1 hypothetical protein [Parachlamydia sp. AcF125]
MNIHFPPTLPPHFPSAPPATKKSTWSKIADFFINFFRYFFPSKKLTEQEAKLVKQTAFLFEGKKFISPTSPSLRQEKKTSYRFSFPASIQDNNEVTPSANYDSSLVAMREFFSHFPMHIADCYYDKYAKNSVEKMSEKAAKLQEYLRAGAKIIVQLGNKTSKIFIDLEANTARIQEMVAKNRSEIDSSLEQMFKWLTEGETQETILNAFLTHSDKLSIPLNKNLQNDYLSPLLAWIFSPTHPNPLTKATRENDKKTFDTILQEIVLILLEKKVDSFVALMHDTLGENKLPQLIQTSLSQVVKKVSDICSDRFANLIHHLNEIKKDKPQEIDTTYYIAAYDDIFKQLESHVDALTRLSADPASFEENFAEEEKVCHPAVKNMILNKKQRAISHVLLNEKKAYFHFAGRLLDLICPPQVVYDFEGYLIKRDGIVDLFYQALPAVSPEFKLLIQKGAHVFQQIMPQEALKHMEKAKRPIIASVERVILNFAKRVIQEKIAELLKDTVNRLATPEHRTALMAEHVLPQINRVLLTQYIYSFFSSTANLPSIAKALEKTKGSENPQAELKPLLSELFGNSTEEERTRLQDKFQIGTTQFDEIYEEFIADIQLTWKKNPNQSAEACLKKYFEFSDVPPKDIYGELIVKLVVKMGKLGFLGEWGGETIARLFIHKINQATTVALHNFSSSHQKVLSTIIQASQKAYGNKSQVDELLFSPASPLLVEENKQKLNIQFALSAFLTYKLCYINAKLKMEEFNAKMGEFGANQTTPSKKTIKGAIKKIYEELFKSELATKSLIFKVFEIVLKALTDAAKNIQDEKK